MPNEPAARLRQPPPDKRPRVIKRHGALSASAHGRAFLAKYLRRNRSIETEMLLGAVDRLAALVRAALAPEEMSKNELTEPASSARPHLSAVRSSEQSELLTPAPGRPPQPTVGLTGAAVYLPEIAPPSNALPATGRHQPQVQDTPSPNAVAPAAKLKSPPATSEPCVSPVSASPSADPLKAIMPLSDEERIALFM